MIPSRGLSRAMPGLAFRNSIFCRTPVRSIPGQAISRPSISMPRQFGTAIRSNVNSNPRPSAAGLLLGSRIGVASIVSSQSFLASNRRFASTDSTTPTTPTTTPPSSELSPDTDFSSFADFEHSSILDIPEHVGYLAKLGLDYGYGPTSLCQWVVEHLHFTMGLGWFGAIVGASLLLRAVMVYPALIAQSVSHKSQEMRKDPVYQEIYQKYMMTMARRGDPAELMQARLQIKYIQEQHGVKTSKMFIPMLQLPFAYGLFKLTRGMAQLPVPGLENAGVLWFTDLTVPDPLYILPCVGSIIMYLSIKRSLPYMATDQAKIMRWLPFIIGPIGFIVSLSFPAAVQVYIASAAILQYLQMTIWHIPLVRKLAGLPPLEKITMDSEVQSRPASPFANRQGTYSSPRTVNTTATEQKPEENASGLKSPLAMFREARKQMSGTLNKYKQDPAEAQRKAALDHDKRAIQNENNAYRARKAEAERRLALKRAEKK